MRRILGYVCFLMATCSIKAQLLHECGKTTPANFVAAGLAEQVLYHLGSASIDAPFSQELTSGLMDGCGPVTLEELATGLGSHHDKLVFTYGADTHWLLSVRVEQLPQEKQELVGSISYHYSNGRPDSISAKLQTGKLIWPSMRFEYLPDGRLLKVYDLTGFFSQPPDQPIWTFAYSSSSALPSHVVRVLPNNGKYFILSQHIEYTIKSGRIIHIEYTGGTRRDGEDFQYDANGKLVQHVVQYGADGKLGGYTLTFKYDEDGHLISQISTLGVAAEYQYDAKGRPAVVVTTSGNMRVADYKFGY